MTNDPAMTLLQVGVDESVHCTSPDGKIVIITGSLFPVQHGLVLNLHLLRHCGVEPRHASSRVGLYVPPPPVLTTSG